MTKPNRSCWVGSHKSPSVAHPPPSAESKGQRILTITADVDAAIVTGQVASRELAEVIIPPIAAENAPPETDATFAHRPGLDHRGGSTRSTRFGPRAVRPIAILLLVTTRSVNSIIWALMLVVLLGPGIPTGVLAIAFRSVGFVGKLVYEAIEEAPELPVTAMETTGAGGAQAPLAFGLVPQILPTMAGVSMYRWEINIREATILGLVGAGGIGMALQASIDALRWSRVSVILLAILATVVFAELVSPRIRRGLG